MTTLPFFDLDDIDLKAQSLRQELVGLIEDRAVNTPRSLQKDLGPSDLSHPCSRKIAYKILDAERCNPPYDPLPSIIGTAVHSWLDNAAGHANQKLGRIRWLRETRVNIGLGVAGNSDLFDTDTGSVIDHKVLGSASFKKNKKKLSPQYRNQIHSYGMGFARAGHTVNYVGALLISKTGLLTDTYLHLEPYNPAIAQQVLNRYETVMCLINDLDVENNPQHIELFEKVEESCLFCPWFSPNAQGPYQCPGDDK